MNPGAPKQNPHVWTLDSAVGGGRMPSYYVVAYIGRCKQLLVSGEQQKSEPLGILAL